jgi:non-homologous end joining protein Ku
MANEIFDDPFQPFDQVEKKDSYSEESMSLSLRDFRLIQRKLESAEESMTRSLEEQAAHLRGKVSDLREKLFNNFRMIKTLEKEKAALWLEKLKLKEEIDKLTMSLRERKGPPF